ncbi:hypothetical protein [Pedobacter jejuensis]|uniref:Uncharacterized protein n=1 Tax=Pedobacter jejuensis TaxID=1268550 RepID=A0A3N0C0V8_9SPHI|nr:hypothetical protein [Pedobacter jejuensis]RNL55827.1 hypothetical protein D7004_03470 [Pedobacter jejuensis]
MTILEGQVFWGYDYDIYNKSNFMKSIMGMFSLMPPLHQYSGRVVLTKTELIILGDTDLNIPLYTIDEVYIGFDEIFPASSVKNLGLFWQPLRVKFRADETVYMVIDYNGINTNNKIWFDALQQILQ